MSEQTLQQFLDRLNADAAFRECAQAAPATAFPADGLPSSEPAALTASDDDALRRLSGTDVAGYFFASLVCSLACPTTPGSGLGEVGGDPGTVEERGKGNIN